MKINYKKPIFTKSVNILKTILALIFLGVAFSPLALVLDSNNKYNKEFASRHRSYPIIKFIIQKRSQNHESK